MSGLYNRFNILTLVDKRCKIRSLYLSSFLTNVKFV